MGHLRVTNSGSEEVRVGAHAFGPNQSLDVFSENHGVYKKAGLDVQFVADDGSVSDKAPKHKKEDDAPKAKTSKKDHPMAKKDDPETGVDAAAKTAATATPAVNQRKDLTQRFDVSAENPSHQTAAQHDGATGGLPDMPIMEPGIKTNPEGTHVIPNDAPAVDSHITNEGGSEGGEDKGILSKVKEVFTSDDKKSSKKK